MPACFRTRTSRAADLPPKTLCLTYDDGPGQRGTADRVPATAELGEYLAAEGICATFFVIGRHAERYAGVLDSLRRSGQMIGNHTYNHPGLVKLAESGGDVVRELAATDVLDSVQCGRGIGPFPRPYGNWRQIDPATGDDRKWSIVADMLNASGRFSDYLGPVNWESRPRILPSVAARPRR